MKTLPEILKERYGVTVLNAPVEALLWAAERLIPEVGPAVAQKALSAANRQREKAGKIPAVAAYGSPLFPKAGSCKGCGQARKLNRYGRCRACQADLQAAVEAAEDRAWDPRP